jgi:murein DD-endopeptidase MepM/ murein hydrolase activator NlpD
MIQNKSMDNKLQTIRKYKWQLIAIFALIFFIILIGVKNHHHKNFIKQNLELPHVYEELEETIQDDNNGWVTITTKSRDTLSSIFKQLNLSQKTLYLILNNNKYSKNLTNIKPGEQIRFLIKDQVLEKIIFPFNSTQLLTINNNKNNNYVTQLESRAIEEHDEFLSVTVKKSIFYTAKNMNIPFTLIQQMAKIFEWEINFNKDIREGDKISIAYQAFYVEDTKVNTGKILAVKYESNTHKLQAIGHKSQDGTFEYYTPEGKSLKKAFARYPIKFTHISSNFSSARMHPILKYARPHKGIDLAARYGTPIYATGDGIITTISMNRGYGNMIKISHSREFASIYAHLSRFQKGLKRGDRIRRGQIIGYVGQTGLATAPHCHYEFHVNQRAQNPATIKLPQAAPIPARELARFNQKSNQLMASLKIFEESILAQTKDKKISDFG